MTDFFTFDDEYVRRLRERERETVDHFIAYFQPLLLTKLRKHLGTHADVEDALQDVFIRVFDSLHTVRDGRKLGAWVNGICDNVIHEKLRNPRRMVPLDENLHDLPVPIDDIVRVLENKETVATVRQVLDELEKEHPKDARLLREFFLEERDKDEICRRLGVDRKYFRVLLHRAILRFAELYRKRVN